MAKNDSSKRDELVEHVIVPMITPADPSVIAEWADAREGR